MVITPVVVALLGLVPVLGCVIALALLHVGHTYVAAPANKRSLFGKRRG